MLGSILLGSGDSMTISKKKSNQLISNEKKIIIYFLYQIKKFHPFIFSKTV